MAWKYLNIGKANEEIVRLEAELAKLTGADAPRAPELEAVIGPKKKGLSGWKFLNIGKANEEITRLQREIERAFVAKNPAKNAATFSRAPMTLPGAPALSSPPQQHPAPAQVPQPSAAKPPVNHGGPALTANQARLVAAIAAELHPAAKAPASPATSAGGLPREKLFALAAVFPLLSLSRDDADQHVRAAVAKAAYQGHCDIPGLTDNAALVSKLWRGEKSVGGSYLRAMRQAAIDGILAK